MIDFDWLVFIGVYLLHFEEKAVWEMTLKRLLKFYDFYKKNYDFQLRHISYAELEEESEKQMNFWLGGD